MKNFKKDLEKILKNSMSEEEVDDFADAIYKLHLEEVKKIMEEVIIKVNVLPTGMFDSTPYKNKLVRDLKNL